MARPIIAMIVSFLITSVLGCAFVFASWMHFNPKVRLVRCFVFVGIMGAVHLVGYRLWKRQRITLPEQTEVRTYASISEAYGKPIEIAVAQQLVLLFFSSLLLDCGQMLAICMFGAVGAWAFNVLIMARRPRSPTRTDVLIVKYGLRHGHPPAL